jgi:hypothetical protein
MAQVVTAEIIEKQKSIHPRVVGGKTKYTKVNTTKKKNPDTIKRAIAGIEKHLEIHRLDGMSQTHLAELKKIA